MKTEDNDYANSEVIELANDYIHSERNRNIVLRRMIDGLTFSELESEFNLSERQLKRIVYKYQDKILFLLSKKR